MTKNSDFDPSDLFNDVPEPPKKPDRAIVPDPVDDGYAVIGGDDDPADSPPVPPPIPVVPRADRPKKQAKPAADVAFENEFESAQRERTREPRREDPAGERGDRDASKPRKKSKSADSSGPRETSKATAEARVDEVWSRSAEWNPTLVKIVPAALVVAFIVYSLLSAMKFGMAFAALFVGCAVLLILSYPILITLERPVRMTPEQAARDYFDALSHHAPHFRRMWLILTTNGRSTPEYSSFAGFCEYWKRRLASLRPSGVGGWTPLEFKVDDFQADKSAGKTAIDADFTVVVSVRGRSTPIASFKQTAGFVKGPDKMWYLNDGRLEK